MTDYTGTSGSDRLTGDRGGGLVQGLGGDDVLTTLPSANLNHTDAVPLSARPGNRIVLG